MRNDRVLHLPLHKGQRKVRFALRPESAPRESRRTLKDARHIRFVGDRDVGAALLPAVGLHKDRARQSSARAENTVTDFFDALGDDDARHFRLFKGVVLCLQFPQTSFPERRKSKISFLRLGAILLSSVIELTACQSSSDTILGKILS